MYLRILFSFLYLQMITAHLGLQSTQRKELLTTITKSYLKRINIDAEYRIDVSRDKCKVTLFQTTSEAPMIPIDSALILAHYLHMMSDIKEMVLSRYGTREFRLVVLDSNVERRQIISSSYELKEGKMAIRYSSSYSQRHLASTDAV